MLGMGSLIEMDLLHQALAPIYVQPSPTFELRSLDTSSSLRPFPHVIHLSTSRSHAFSKMFTVSTET